MLLDTRLEAPVSRCQAICYLYLVCDHLSTCLNVWHGENESNRKRQDMDYTSNLYEHELYKIAPP